MMYLLMNYIYDIYKINSFTRRVSILDRDSAGSKKKLNLYFILGYIGIEPMAQSCKNRDFTSNRITYTFTPPSLYLR